MKTRLNVQYLDRKSHCAGKESGVFKSYSPRQILSVLDETGAPMWEFELNNVTHVNKIILTLEKVDESN